jgi:hypothetical protein
MRFSTDDGTFALTITPTRGDYGADLFRFQLVIAGELVGDSDPSILGSAVDFGEREADR